MPDRTSDDVVNEGTLRFTIESRIVRELGERLVKQPDVALVELIKNSYDADASTCHIRYEPSKEIVVRDDGHGMTFATFERAWMRIGTSAKEATPRSARFGRIITGDKGIGRFAVRCLGRVLDLETIADDVQMGFRTRLVAHFDWVTFDRNEDLGDVTVPFTVTRVLDGTPTGTKLIVSNLRDSTSSMELKSVRTASIAVVSPFRTLIDDNLTSLHESLEDPGFRLSIGTDHGANGDDLADLVLTAAVLRATIQLRDHRLKLKIYQRGSPQPVLSVNDRYPSGIGTLSGDIRFFPRRKGTFAQLAVAGRRAQQWVRANSGVAVFDRSFRVLPYGLPGDDWLQLAADTARRMRDPRSSIATKHFPMSDEVKASTQLNYMLRLPYPEQLVGVVQVEGLRSVDQTGES